MTILLPGGPTDKRSIDLCTRTRRRIDNEQMVRRPLEAMRAASDRHLEAFRGRIVLRAMDSIYNCVGLVFANRRTAIDTSLVEAILADDGYERLQNLDVASVGDVAIYRRGGDIAHVGFVAGVQPDLATAGPTRLRVLSQWGFDGEYLHDADAVPSVNGNLREVWTFRYGRTR